MKCMKRWHAINALGGHLFFRRCVMLCVLCAEETALLDDLPYFLCKSTKGFFRPQRHQTFLEILMQLAERYITTERLRP